MGKPPRRVSSPSPEASSHLACWSCFAIRGVQISALPWVSRICEATTPPSKLYAKPTKPQAAPCIFGIPLPRLPIALSTAESIQSTFYFNADAQFSFWSTENRAQPPPTRAFTPPRTTPAIESCNEQWLTQEFLPRKSLANSTAAAFNANSAGASLENRALNSDNGAK